jgi:hypothetical protein
MKNTLIPEQEKGSKFDVSANISLNSNTETLAFFQGVKQRLLNVNGWDEVCGFASSTFKLINAKNQEIVGFAKEGDFIRINIPGPGTKIGEGYDWVRIEQIAEQLTSNAELLSITVRPCGHPLKQEKITAHFFQPIATSTFQVKRIANVIYAEVHGRNELPNNKEGALLDKVRNTMVGIGAKMGFSYPQWKMLADGLIKN